MMELEELLKTREEYGSKSTNASRHSEFYTYISRTDDPDFKPMDMKAANSMQDCLGRIEARLGADERPTLLRPRDSTAIVQSRMMRVRIASLLLSAIGVGGLGTASAIVLRGDWTLSVLLLAMAIPLAGIAIASCLILSQGSSYDER